MLMLTAQIDPAAWQAASQELADLPQALERARTRAINTTLRRANTKILRMISGELNISQSELKQPHGKSPAAVRVNKARFGDPWGTIFITGRRIPLRWFGARPNKPRSAGSRSPADGVSYSIRRGGGQTNRPNAFVVKFKSGHIAVVARLGEGQPRRRVGARGQTGPYVHPRLPLTALHGPSVPEALVNAPDFAKDVIEAEMAEHLTADFCGQVDLLLRQHGRDAGGGDGSSGEGD